MNALILVDIQNDFLPGGALAVPSGDEVIPIANRVRDRFDLVVATQDWHPPNHGSFAVSHPGKRPGDIVTLNGIEQVLWPVHCVQDTHGAEFAPGFDTGGIDRIFRKGIDPGIDSYSTFFDNGRRRSTGLADYLMECHVDDVAILGLATDYCVLFSALDAVRLGFRTRVIVDGCRGVGLQPGDVDRAYREMEKVGVVLAASEKLA
jgi:nicotinamidase/pyrazinamidase